MIVSVSARTAVSYPEFSGRRYFLNGFMLICMTILIGRAIWLQVLEKQFLQAQGALRHVSDIPVSAYRGMIVDRNGAPLAISAPVASIAINPKELSVVTDDELKEAVKKQGKVLGKRLDQSQKEDLKAELLKEKNIKVHEVEAFLKLPTGKIASVLHDNSNRVFVYLMRRIDPQLGDRITELKVRGIYVEREFKRFYPAGEIFGHLVGFTDAEDIGQTGLEAGYENLLKGMPGTKRVIRDGLKQVIENVENIKEPIAGKNLELSVDQRIQYLAYKELQNGVNAHQAKAGMVVVLDAKTGEILAAANQPGFNPNTRGNLQESHYRNRALTEVFEPGSTVKPLVVAAALDGGFIRPQQVFDTNGTFRIDRHSVHDVHNYGRLDLTGVIKKSSNIALSQIALKMPPNYFWQSYHTLGFGTMAHAGFPGEAAGILSDYHRWRDFDRAVLSFGYGLNASAVQIARAYTALADDGILHSVSLLKRDEDVDAKRVFTAATAKKVRTMMESVVSKDGTAYEARIDGYSVAGKTGTVKKAGPHGYSANTYFSVFAGMVPASNPRLIGVVMIDEPSSGQYYGGLVAAPVFSKIMAGALRVLEVAPDRQETMPVLLSRQPS
jgi:cell division protein FtsI (penicillin-binding protein 3)